MHIVSNGDSLHEMSNPVFMHFMQIVSNFPRKRQILCSGKNKKSISLLSAEFDLTVVKVK